MSKPIRKDPSITLKTHNDSKPLEQSADSVQAGLRNKSVRLRRWPMLALTNPLSRSLNPA